MVFAENKPASRFGWTKKKHRPPYKIHGGKFYLARRFIPLFPREIHHYVEPFMGGASVFLNLGATITGRACLFDADSLKVNAMKAIQLEPTHLADRLRDTFYREETFEAAKKALAWYREHPPFDTYTRVAAAAAFITVNRMSRGGLGKVFAWSERLRGGRPGDLNAWHTAIDDLPALSERLRDAVIQCCDFAAAVPQFLDHPSNFIYLDPPYMPAARGCRKAYGPHEMTPEQHEAMAGMLNRASCHIAVSGYDTPEYRSWFGHWRRVEFDVANHSGQSKTKQRRTEVLWLNYTPDAEMCHEQPRQAA